MHSLALTLIYYCIECITRFVSLQPGWHVECTGYNCCWATYTVFCYNPLQFYSFWDNLILIFIAICSRIYMDVCRLAFSATGLQTFCAKKRINHVLGFSIVNKPSLLVQSPIHKLPACRSNPVCKLVVTIN